MSILMVILATIIQSSICFLFPFNPTTRMIEDYKLCGNCQFFIPEKEYCCLFGSIDVVSGEVYYSSCHIVRANSSLCGGDGKFFSRRIPFDNDDTMEKDE